MSFSPEWNSFHETGHRTVGRYEELEKLVNTFVVEAPKMLELGSGYGGEIPFFRDYKKFGYHGIEGSQAAVDRLREEHPGVHIDCGDFTDHLPDGEYDLIVDRASVAHNRIDAIERCIRLVHSALKPGGLFISSDWFSANHSERARGKSVELGCEESRTNCDYPDGQFAGVGCVHFSDEYDLDRLFASFELIDRKERVTRWSGNCPRPNYRYISPAFIGQEYRSAVWDIVVRKPA